VQVYGSLSLLGMLCGINPELRLMGEELALS
jgi:hypothetical protein